MILQALAQYYDTLCRTGKLSPPGWDDGFRVTFGLELSETGELKRLIDYRQEEARGKKTVLVPQIMRVPAHEARSSGVCANFLCDNSSYLLGVDEKGKPQRSLECFRACAALHRKLLENVDTVSARAILAFFDRWQPEKAAEHPVLTEQWKTLMGNANLIFTRDSEPVTKDNQICAAWQRYYDQADGGTEKGQCLITGETVPIAMTHPLIKGVQGAQSSGAALVSFNAPAFCSYGHTQNGNAPVGKTAAFSYTTALNTLLADREHCRRVGDTTIVCWSEHGVAAYQDSWIASMFGQEEGFSDRDLRDAVNKLSKGEPCAWEDVTLLPEEHFYILGLSPNAARLSVRFFLQDSFGAIMKNIRKHYEDIQIVRPVFDKTVDLPAWRLLAETVNQNARDKSASPQLSGDLLRAILTGTPYPATLLNGVQLRIRAEHQVTRGRAAILKGYYLRSNDPNVHKEVFTMNLNEDSDYLPYVLGRVFSILEDIQESANPGINATIKDKYFNSASASPATVFPLLINLAQKHLRKLDSKKKSYYHNALKKQLDKIHTEHPARMTMAEQGAFQLGYYHQTQMRYTKKKEKENV